MKSKKLTVFEAPIFNRSGYGKWADDLAACLLTHPELDVYFAPTSWGSCAQRRSTTPQDRFIMERVLKQPLKGKPDIHITQTLPHLSNPQGKFNINITAGIEVDKCYPQIIEGVNKHDLTVVCSHFAKQVFLNSDPKPTKPIEVLHWAADFQISQDCVPSVADEMAKIKEDECFLFIGQYTSYHIFNDRKDIGNLIKTFCQAFKGKDKKPALLLKTNGVNFSYADRNVILDKIQSIKATLGDDLPNVYVLHGEMNEAEMASLINHKKVIAHISFTHSEGFGHPLLLASMSGKPVFASNYSAHTEFLGEKSPLLAGNLVTIPQDVVSEYFMAGSKWFNVDYAQAAKTLQEYYYGDRTAINAQAAELAKVNQERFNLKKMEYRCHKLLNKYV